MEIYSDKQVMAWRFLIIIFFISVNNFAAAQVSTRAKIAESIESVFNSDCRQKAETSFATRYEAECKILNKANAATAQKSSQDIEESLFFEYAGQKQIESLQCELKKINEIQNNKQSLSLIVDDINRKLPRMREIFKNVIQGPGKNSSSRCVRDIGEGKLEVEIVKAAKTSANASRSGCLSEEKLRKEFEVLKSSVWSGQDQASQKFIDKIIRHETGDVSATKFSEQVLVSMQKKRVQDLQWFESGRFRTDEDFKIATVQDGFAVSLLSDLRQKGVNTDPMLCSLEARYGSGRKKMFWISQGAIFAATLGAGPFVGMLSGAVKAGQVSTRAAQILSIGTLDVANAYFSDCLDETKDTSLTLLCSGDEVSLQKDIQKSNCAGALVTSTLATVGSEAIDKIWDIEKTVNIIPTSTQVKSAASKLSVPNIEGDRLKVVDTYIDSNGQAVNVAIDKQSPLGVISTGFEAMRVDDMVYRYPNMGRSFNIKKEKGKLYYPANSEAMNFYLNKYYQGLPEEYQAGLRYIDVDGQIAPTQYLENWVDGKVPFARKARDHFHDVNNHLPGYAVLPKEVVKRSQDSVSLLLKMKNDPLLAGNPEIAKLIKAMMKQATDALETAPSNTLTMVPSDIRNVDKDELKEKINQLYSLVANPYDTLKGTDIADMNVTEQQRKRLLEYSRKMKENFERKLPDVAELLLNHPVLRSRAESL